MSEIITTRAVIVAGGQGARFGGAIPKQYSLLRGKPLLFYSVEALASFPGVAEIVLVLPSGSQPSSPELSTIFANAAPAPTIRRVEGGKRRQDSVATGLAAFSGPCEVALVHDAARPFLPCEPTLEAIRRAREIGGAILASRVTETIKRANANALIAETIDRSGLWLAQTPQCIRGDHIPALIEVLRGPGEFTDEAAALESMRVPVEVVESPASNLKITQPGDLEVAEAILDRIRLS